MQVRNDIGFGKSFSVARHCTVLDKVFGSILHDDDNSLEEYKFEEVSVEDIGKIKMMSIFLRLRDEDALTVALLAPFEIEVLTDFWITPRILTITEEDECEAYLTGSDEEAGGAGAGAAAKIEDGVKKLDLNIDV